ncbi:hypothetical protein C5167_034944 [Papaver somniferum]|uniref:Uncharacterized protein n=1 Tax=Papaver somniferum TaxID=3469 RepID=A0A4Y7KHY7_PAPSO|nr:hypothetical protein C5167_034944 [Papaver somniferum]
MIDDRSGRVIVEKMSRLIRNAYKTVAYGLKHHTVNQRLLQSAYKFDTHYDELSKVAAEVNELTCPKKIEEAIRVLQMGNESGALLDKLIDDYTHFKLHEEPNLTASNMLRDIALPCSAGAGLTFLLGNLKGNCQHLKGNIQHLKGN